MMKPAAMMVSCWAPQRKSQEQPSTHDFEHTAVLNHHCALFHAVCEQQVNKAMKFVQIHQSC